MLKLRCLQVSVYLAGVFIIVAICCTPMAIAWAWDKGPVWMKVNNGLYLNWTLFFSVVGELAIGASVIYLGSELESEVLREQDARKKVVDEVKVRVGRYGVWANWVIVAGILWVISGMVVAGMGATLGDDDRQALMLMLVSGTIGCKLIGVLVVSMGWSMRETRLKLDREGLLKLGVNS